MPINQARRPRILFLAPLVPYPLVSGGQIRSYSMLQALAEEYDVTLLSFARHDADEQAAKELQAFCKGGVHTILRPRGRARDLGYLWQSRFRRLPWVIQREESGAMRRRVADCLETGDYAALHVDHLHMMHPVPQALGGIRLVLDAHNVESDLLQQIAHLPTLPSPMRRLLHNEARRLAQYERIQVARADRLLTVSQQDAARFARLLGSSERVRTVPIADPTLTQYRRITPRAILLLGPLHWPPNADAARWFGREILPRLRHLLPHEAIIVRIVGANLPADVRRWAKLEGVTVVGEIDDLTKEWERAAVLAVPLRAGSGTRVKILSAWDAGVPVVSTPIGADGLTQGSEAALLLAADADGFARAVYQVLTDGELAYRMAYEGWQLVDRYHRYANTHQAVVAVYRELLSH